MRLVDSVNFRATLTGHRSTLNQSCPEVARWLTISIASQDPRPTPIVRAEESSAPGAGSSRVPRLSYDSMAAINLLGRVFSAFAKRATILRVGLRTPRSIPET